MNLVNTLWLLSSSWWQASSNLLVLKDELDPDPRSIASQALLAAKLAVESLSNPYTYAVSFTEASNDSVYLAVANTPSQSNPILCAKSSLPLDYRESQERSLNPPPDTPSFSFPTVDGCYRARTLVTRARLVLQASIPDSLRKRTRQWLERHIYRAPSSSLPRKLSCRHILIVSFHGWVPAKYLRANSGYSTGSARLLAATAVDQVKTWLGLLYSENTHSIHTVAIQSFGPISSRSEALYTLLKNWCHELDSADYVFVVSSSVSFLVAFAVFLRLLQERYTAYHYGRKRISFLCFGASALGPVPGTDARLVRRAYSTLELSIITDILDFSRPASAVSKDADTALLNLLAYGNVRVIWAASALDTQVPLFSALALHYRHPHIMRIMHASGVSDPPVPRWVSLLLEIIVTLENAGHPTNCFVLQELSARCVSADDAGLAANLILNREIYLESTRVALETTSLVTRQDLFIDRNRLHLSSHPHLQQLQLQAHPVANSSVDTPVSWHLRSLFERLAAVNNVGNARLVCRLVEDYTTWAKNATGSRVFRDASQHFGALADVKAVDFLM